MNDPHAVRRLVLTDFRNYAALSLTVPAGPIVLTGANGAGKTNILEAVSLLVPGRGLRQVGLDDPIREGGAGGWAVAADIDSVGGPMRIGTGVQAGTPATSRDVRIDGAAQSSVQVLGTVFSAIWLTPQMDFILSGPAGDRRRFFDRLVLSLNPDHGRRYAAFERAMRQRNKALEQGRDRHWLDAIESEMAAQAIAVAAARVEVLTALAGEIHATRNDASPFPWAALSLQGPVEEGLAENTATAAEDAYRATLASARHIDARAGRTLEGPHRSDLLVRHGPKDTEARRASTGEQKALLVGLLMAHARLIARHRDGRAPVLLFDEIAAHLDDLRRQALFDAIRDLGVQAFLTGTDAALFAPVRPNAHFLEIAAGRVREPQE